MLWAARRRRNGSKRSKLRYAELAAESRSIRDVHDVRVRETDEGEIVNFHCRVDPQLERSGRARKVSTRSNAPCAQRSPSIKRVIGHAEPAR